MRIVLLVMVILQLVLNVTTDVNVDFTQSVAQCNLPMLQRVSKKVEINYDFNLVSTGWNQFPDMRIDIVVPYPQFVKVKYNICYWLSGESHFATRLMVDGTEDREYTAHLTALWTPCLFRIGQIYLQTGKHTFIVQYRTDSPRLNSKDMDWNRNFLKVEYYEKVPTS